MNKDAKNKSVRVKVSFADELNFPHGSFEKSGGSFLTGAKLDLLEKLPRSKKKNLEEGEGGGKPVDQLESGRLVGGGTKREHT